MNYWFCEINLLTVVDLMKWPVRHLPSAENVELQTQLQLAYIDNEALGKEVAKLKTELSNFGPEFFEEIEDLKFNYREALKKNVEYEEKLMHLSKQFGVDVNIPL